MFGNRDSNDPFEIQDEISSKLDSLMAIFEDKEEEAREDLAELKSAHNVTKYLLEEALAEIEDLKLRVLWAERDTDV